MDKVVWPRYGDLVVSTLLRALLRTLVIIPGFNPSLLNLVSGPTTCLPLLNGTVLIEFVLLQMAAASTAQRFCNLLNAPEYKRFDCL
jgi:hypothetical protein